MFTTYVAPPLPATSLFCLDVLIYYVPIRPCLKGAAMLSTLEKVALAKYNKDSVKTSSGN